MYYAVFYDRLCTALQSGLVYLGRCLGHESILVNGQSLEISENLFDFLMMRRTIDNAADYAKSWLRVVGRSEEWLWADQVCI